MKGPSLQAEKNRIQHRVMNYAWQQAGSMDYQCTKAQPYQPPAAIRANWENRLGYLPNTTEFAGCKLQRLSRTEQLKEFIREDPTDPFNHYALAMELARTEPSAALEKFKEVIEHFPTYLPSYYTTARLLSEAGQKDEAATIAAKGIELARQSGDRKALSELTALKEEIEW